MSVTRTARKVVHVREVSSNCSARTKPEGISAKSTTSIPGIEFGSDMAKKRNSQNRPTGYKRRSLPETARSSYIRLTHLNASVHMEKPSHFHLSTSKYVQKGTIVRQKFRQGLASFREANLWGKEHCSPLWENCF